MKGAAVARAMSWGVHSGVKRALSTASGKRKLTLNELQSITQTIHERLREEKGPQLSSIAQIPNVLHECQRKFDAGMELLNPIIEETVSKHGYTESAAGRDAFVEDFAAFALVEPNSLPQLTIPFHSMASACFNIPLERLPLVPRVSIEAMVTSEIEEMTSEAMTLLPSSIASQFPDRKQQQGVLRDFVAQLQVYAATADEEVFGSGDEDEAVMWCKYHTALQLWLPTLRPELRDELLRLRAKVVEHLNRDPNW